MAKEELNENDQNQATSEHRNRSSRKLDASIRAHACMLARCEASATCRKMKVWFDELGRTPKQLTVIPCVFLDALTCVCYPRAILGRCGSETMQATTMSLLRDGPHQHHKQFHA
jgi:hypothetical protein